MDEQHNPWTIVDQKEVYDNKWINVTEYNVLNPSGGKGIYGKVHFKNKAIGIIALDNDLNTYLVGQYRFTLDRYSWEIPEGGGPHDEEIIEAAKRELKEETGLVAESWEQIVELHLSNSVTDEYGVIFLATGLVQDESMPEETEQLSIKKVKFSELYKLVNDGVITDSLTVAGVLKVQLMLLEGKLNVKAPKQ